MSSLITRARSLHRTEVAIAARLQHVFLLMVRLYWGWQFFIAGRGKLLNIERTAGFFDSLDIPLPTLNAYMAGSVECFGGLLLLLGLASRITTIPLIGTMCVAYVTAHAAELRSLFSNPDAFVTAAPFLFLLAALIVLLFGPGVFSLDYLIGRRLLQPGTMSSKRDLFQAAIPAPVR